MAVLLKPVAPVAPAADKFNFTSPVMTVTFDQVKLLTEVTPSVAVRGNGYTVTAALPWALLGVAPKAELMLGPGTAHCRTVFGGEVGMGRLEAKNR